MIVSTPFQIALPPGVSRITPASVEYRMVVPRILGGEVVFPPGAAGLAGVMLETRGAPILNWTTGDGRTFTWRGGPYMAGPPFIVTVWGYNLDDTWPHTISGSLTLAADDGR